MEDKEVIFREVQRFDQWWLWTLVWTPVGIAVLWVAAVVVHTAARDGDFAGIKGDIVSAIFAIAALVAVSVLFFALTRLVTEVRRDGLQLRYVPFHLSFRRIPLDDVIRCQAVTYRPVRDYGGWGIRGCRGGRAYNVSGNRGVRLDYEDGTHLLIGSQRPEELAQAIQSLLDQAQ